jgi:hypothetical protein
MLPNTVVGAIELASKVKKAVLGAEGVKLLQGKSLIDVAQVARVEPIVMVDADCMNIEGISDIMQVLHSMFAGYYLQAVNMVNTIGGVSVAERLAPLNPNAGAVFEELALAGRCATSMEDYKFKLPSYAKGAKPALEDMKISDVNDEALKQVREASNLAVGKMFNVLLTNGESSVTVPVAIRLMANSIPSRTMAELFANTDAFDLDMKERWHAWRAGRLSLVGDLILCNDLIDKRMRSSINDPSGVLETVRNRQTGNLSSMAISGKASVANATNIAVVSSETLAQAESTLGGPIKNDRVRKAIFESTNLMIIAVVNKQWERVTFWFRGLDSTTNLSYRELKTAGKNDGSNVTDILKAYIAGAAPNQF